MDDKSKSYVFVLLSLLVVGVSIFLAANYVNSMLTAIINFINKNGISNLQECGILLPPELTVLKSDINTIIIPFMYYGLPLLFLIVFILMFLAGFYYHKGRIDEHEEAEMQLKRAVVKRLVKKMESGKK
jgi:hypothetical protein